MVVRQSSQGLARAQELYQNRDHRARELKRQGQKVVGYFCCFPPLEVITAAGALPLRLMGNSQEPVTAVDTYLETNVCPYVRSCLDLGLKGRYDFLDGLVMTDSCDNVNLSYDIFRYHFKTAYSHFVNTPHNLYSSAYPFLKGEFQDFAQRLGRFTGTPVTEECLREAIALHNENRTAFRRLYGLRKQEPALLKGSEVTRLVVASLTIPAQESTRLLHEAIEEVDHRSPVPQTGPRLLLYGCELDDATFVELVEEVGGQVVMDDLCLGSRFFWREVPVTPDPWEGLVTHYLDHIMCPRTHRDGIEARLGYLREYVQDFRVAGAILYILRYCDIFKFDVPDVRDYLKGLGVPSLQVESDYHTIALGQMKTRLQAFIEMLGV